MYRVAAGLTHRGHLRYRGHHTRRRQWPSPRQWSCAPCRVPPPSRVHPCLRIYNAYTTRSPRHPPFSSYRSCNVAAPDQAGLGTTTARLPYWLLVRGTGIYKWASRHHRLRPLCCSFWDFGISWCSVSRPTPPCLLPLDSLIVVGWIVATGCAAAPVSFRLRCSRLPSDSRF